MPNRSAWASRTSSTASSMPSGWIFRPKASTASCADGATCSWRTRPRRSGRRGECCAKAVAWRSRYGRPSATLGGVPGRRWWSNVADPAGSDDAWNLRDGESRADARPARRRRLRRASAGGGRAHVRVRGLRAYWAYLNELAGALALAIDAFSESDRRTFRERLEHSPRRTAPTAATRCPAWCRTRSLPERATGQSGTCPQRARKSLLTLVEKRGISPETFSERSHEIATIRELAQLSGVSVATVSRVLNDYADVSDETREQVLKHARELDYTLCSRQNTGDAALSGDRRDPRDGRRASRPPPLLSGGPRRAQAQPVPAATTCCSLRPKVPKRFQ